MAAYWKLLEPVWETINIYDGPAVYLETFRAVPEPVGLLFAGHWAYFEICNGGFGQFFSNSTGVLAPEALRCFREIGQRRTAEILQRAMAHFGPIYPRDRAERNGMLENASDPSRLWLDPALQPLTDEVFEHIGDEAGGFEAAADRYAQPLGGNGLPTHG